MTSLTSPLPRPLQFFLLRWPPTAIDMALPAQRPLIPPVLRTEVRSDGISLLPFLRSFLPGCFDLEGPLWLLHFTLVYFLFFIFWSVWIDWGGC
jgi:hypothetical protein